MVDATRPKQVSETAIMDAMADAIGDFMVEGKAEVVDLDLTRLIGTEPEILAGHSVAEQAFRTCADVISGVKKKLAWCTEDKNLSEEAIAKSQAKVILAEQKRLANVGTVCESLASNAKAHRLKYNPAMANDPTVSAAIWTVLSSDSLEVQQAYMYALDDNDGRVMNAIESLTSLHDNRIPEERLAELREQRFKQEQPELFKQAERAKEIHGAIESVHRTTESVLSALGTIVIGKDGVPTFGPAAGGSGFTVRE